MAPKGAAAAPPMSMDIGDFLGETPDMACPAASPSFVGKTGSFAGSSAPSPALEKEMATTRKLREELTAANKKAPAGRAPAGGAGAELKRAQDDCADLRQQLEEGQRALEATSRAANEALKDMRVQEAQAVEAATERSESMMAEVQAAAEQLERFTRPQRLRSERLRQRIKDKSTLQGKARRALSKSFAKELAAATAGKVVDKIDQRKGGKQVRLMQIDDEEGLLRWGAPPGPLASNCTCLSLEQVLRLEYGRGSRAWALYPAMPQWLCFSLYTTDRSFDYICAADADVQAFVVSISRLYPRIVGSFPSRSAFIQHKGWLKIQDTCARRTLTPAQGLLKAVRKAGNDARARRAANRLAEGLDDDDEDEDDFDEEGMGGSFGRGGAGANPFTFVGTGSANPFTFIGTKSDGSKGSGGANPFTFIGAKSDKSANPFTFVA